MAIIGLTPSSVSFQPMFMAPEVQPKRSKRVRFDATIRYVEDIKEDDVDEDEYYLQKIQELVNQKKALFSHEDQPSPDHDQEEVIVKDAKKTKKPWIRRRRSPTVEENKKNQWSSDHDQEEVVVEVAKKTKKPANKRPGSPTDEDDENEKKQKKKRIQNVGSAISSEISERLKEVITEEMKGSELKLVIKKQLYATDLSKTQNRLSMPINQLETVEFLTADEKQLLDAGGSFDVPVVGPTLQMHEKPMTLIRWNLVTSSNYILRSNWHKFVANNSQDLTVNTKIQVWSFRRDQELCFAIACVGMAGDENDAAC